MDVNMEITTESRATDTAKGWQFQHHTLRFDFPACDLLPKGKRPFIKKPTAMDDRNEPEYTPIGLGEDDVEFHIRFNTTFSSSEENVDMSRLTHPLNLNAAIRQLSMLAGISQLRIVSYVEDDDVLTRFQVTTDYYVGDARIPTRDYEFEMGSIEVKRMMRRMRTEEWAKQLTDLIHCDSDRAYLNISAKLLDYDVDWAVALEESWGEGWDSRPPKSVRQMFADRLVNYYQREDGSSGTEPIGPLTECRGMAIHALLPCGHPTLLPSNFIHQTSLVDLVHAICDGCDKRIMSRKDLRLLSLYREKIKCLDWEEAMMVWVNKCRKVRNDARVVEITSAALIKSLQDTLQTFKLPAPISPQIYCPTTQPESLALLEKLGEALKPYATLPPMTPKQLFNNLEELAWTLLGKSFANTQVMSAALPPGFDNFLTRWLTRAVNDAVGTQADEENDQDVMDVLQKMQKTKIDPEAAAVEGDLDDILEKFGEGGLLGDGADGDCQEEEDSGEDDDEEL